MKTTTVTLSVPDPGRFEEVVRAAEGHGFAVKKSFPSLGLATGAVDAGRVAALRALSGVGSVEEERVYQTPRPV